MTDDRIRCSWAQGGAEMRYHDREWGVPVHNDRKLFEFLILEGAQAGLSWSTILAKRPAYREVFDGFDPKRVARFNKSRVERLMNDARIVRNRLKIESTIANAKATLAIQDSHGSLDKFLWSFVGGRPKQNAWKRRGSLPASTRESEAMSKALKAAGFSFVGTTISYAFMQAVGMVNDHVVECFRWKELRKRAD